MNYPTPFDPITARLIHRRKWFHPVTWPQVGWIKKKGCKTRALYDTGERLPGGIPVLAVRREAR